MTNENKFISANTEIIIFEQKTDTITYITSPEGLTAIVVASSNTAGREWYWVFTDHLGSITTLVRNSDEQKVEMSYDAWGNRRDPATWENYNGTLPSFITDRGYTGHEHLDEFTLINMNGRMYDPQTARFLSPDVVVSDPSNPSSFNPYAYVLNNPLRYTDPSGYEPFTIAAAAIAAFILYGSHAKQNADPATGKWDWNITNWFGKDKPGLMLGITNTSFKHFFSNTTFFVSMDNTNGAGITLGYHTKYHFGSGSSPQNLYFPNDNTSAAEAAAVNSIARGTGYYSKITAAIDNYMDILTANVMRSYGGTWLPGIVVVWNGKYGSGSVVGGVPEWWSGGTASGGGGEKWFGMIPVAQTFALDLDVIVVAGTEISPIGGGIIYKGKDKGKTFAYSDAGKVFKTYGINLSGGVESYIWYYTGDIQNFSIETFNGTRNEFEVGFATYGTGITWSSLDQFGGRLIGVKGDYSTPSPVSIYGFTLNYSYGKTWCY